MKVIFFGTPDLGAQILDSLIESRHEVIAVVTQPDRASGRGGKVSFSPVKARAMEAEIPVLQPEKIADEVFLDELEALGADIMVVAAYAQKLPNRLLDMAPYQCINVHPSLLPKCRGCAPFVAPILDGDKESGVTIMKMAEKMDTGDILLQESIPLAEDETAETLEAKAVTLGRRMIIEAIDGLEAGTVTATPQPAEGATYVKMLNKEAGLADFSKPADLIERMTRAYAPWPGVYTYLDGKTFKIISAEVECESEETGVPGEVVVSEKKRFGIRTGCGILFPKEVQLEGKKRMTVEEFLRGKKIEKGYVFANSKD